MLCCVWNTACSLLCVNYVMTYSSFAGHVKFSAGRREPDRPVSVWASTPLSWWQTRRRATVDLGGEWGLSPLRLDCPRVSTLSGENTQRRRLMGSCCIVHRTWQVEVYSKSFKKEGCLIQLSCYASCACFVRGSRVSLGYIGVPATVDALRGNSASP